MFPLQQRGDELFFHISSDRNERHKIPEDQILLSHHNHHVGYDHYHHNKTGRVSYRESDNIEGRGRGAEDNMGDCPKRRRSSSVSCRKLKQCGGSGSGDNNNSKKKMMHRDTERRRRQDMATLYASLRSLLPLEFIKGKRSISDQVNESVNYIKHRQRNIKELSSKRDELMLLSSSSSRSFNSNIDNSSNENSGHVVVVRPSLVGVEVVFSGSSDRPRLSSVLQVLLEQGLGVLSCISSKVDDQLIHNILGEVKDSAGFEISELQDRLKRLILL